MHQKDGSKIFIQPPDHQRFEEFLSYAKEEGCNLEIASFAYPDVLDGGWEEILEDHRDKLQDFRGRVSLHGPFLDLFLHSQDQRIKEVARDRIFQSLEIASRLGAEYVVFHGNFSPLIGHESYRKHWIAQNFYFWSEVLSRYRITVLLENLWEPTPDLYRELLDRVNSPRLKVCLDTGHVNVFSQATLEEWLAALGNDVAYVHVNDNQGRLDNELVPGEGNIDWQSFSESITRSGIAPSIVFEVGTLQKTIRSIEYFRERDLYPFNLSSR